MNAPLVSVVIPTYNRANLIGNTIENVFKQTYKNFELIVIDDGSTDDTQAKLAEFGSRIRLITQANAGPAVARNRGIEAARGEIVAFQDSDDLWNPVKLERQVALLTKYDASVPCCLSNADMGMVDGKPETSFGEAFIFPEHDEGLWLNVAEVLATRFVLFNQTVAIRRKVLEKVGGFPVDLKYLEDYDLPLRLALEGPWAFIREPMVIYNPGSPHSFAQQAQKDQVVLKECAVKIFEQMLARVGDGNQQARLRKLVEHRLSIYRHQLTAARLSKASFSGSKAVNALQVAVDHYVFALFRRSPWFPQPKSLPVGAAHPSA